MPQRAAAAETALAETADRTGAAGAAVERERTGNRTIAAKFKPIIDIM
jgi:hypothetical protein